MTGDSEAAEALRRWARGLLTVEAATELLIRSFRGRFALPGNPWVRTDRGGPTWIEWSAINDDTVGALSGGERRMLRAAASLGGGGLVDLGDVATGMDQWHTRLLLAAVSHAAGFGASAWPDRS